LTALDSACTDSGTEAPVYLQINDDDTIIVRAQNAKTGQQALGVMTAYKGIEAEFLQPEAWETKGKYDDAINSMLKSSPVKRTLTRRQK
jgi:hypothetical protein